MALAGNQARIFIDNVDLSCVTATLNVESTTGEYDATVLCSDVMEYRPGLSQGGITIDGFFDGVLTGTEAALYAALGATSKIVGAVFDFSNIPAPAYMIENASNMGLTWASPTDGLITINGSFKGKEGLKRGKILNYDVSRSATGLMTAGQIPGTLVGSTGRIFLIFHSYTGALSGDVTATVQSSANGTSGWANEASFTFSVAGAQVAALTSPAGEYFAVNVTSLGGATTVNLSLIVVVDDVT